MNNNPILDEIEKDIEYFKKLGFVELAKKFQRDADYIRSVTKNNQ